MTYGTCLDGGTVVTLTGSGYDESSLGTVAECDDDSSQPTVALPPPISQNVPVGCSGPSIALAKTTTVSGERPPCGNEYLITTCPTDSSGGNAETDARAYPCPPTPAQKSVGISCILSFSDTKGKVQSVDTESVDISFLPDPT